MCFSVNHSKEGGCICGRNVNPTTLAALRSDSSTMVVGHYLLRNQPDRRRLPPDPMLYRDITMTESSQESRITPSI
jgi:hypothetical protein